MVVYPTLSILSLVAILLADHAKPRESSDVLNKVLSDSGKRLNDVWSSWNKLSVS